MRAVAWLEIQAGLLPPKTMGCGRGDKLTVKGVNGIPSIIKVRRIPWRRRWVMLEFDGEAVRLVEGDVAADFRSGIRVVVVAIR